MVLAPSGVIPGGDLHDDADIKNTDQGETDPGHVSLPSEMTVAVVGYGRATIRRQGRHRRIRTTSNHYPDSQVAHRWEINAVFRQAVRDSTDSPNR